MVAMPLAHISWAIADNADRPACDAFFIDIFGAETAFEMLITPETEAPKENMGGLDREERLMLVGDTMLIPIAPAGRAVAETSPIGGMLRRSAGAGRWLGVALRVADLAGADAWLRAKGFQLHYDPGMESHYFLISRKQAMGMRIEILCHGLPNDPREKGGWRPERWAEDHPLGIEGVQAIALSVPNLAAARELFAGRLEWPELAQWHWAGQGADCAAFAMGDVVIEALAARDDGSPVAAHLRDCQGIYGICFKVRDARAAADYLRAKGLNLIGDLDGRFAIAPEQAMGRTIWFSECAVNGYPAVGSRLRNPAVFPV